MKASAGRNPPTALIGGELYSPEGDSQRRKADRFKHPISLKSVTSSGAERSKSVKSVATESAATGTV